MTKEGERHIEQRKQILRQGFNERLNPIEGDFLASALPTGKLDRTNFDPFRQ